VRVFKLNQADWYAAETIEEAIQCAADHWCGGSLMELIVSGMVEDPGELKDAEMDSLKHHGDEDNRLDPPLSFSLWLKAMIAKGEKFPCFFASSEH